MNFKVGRGVMRSHPVPQQPLDDGQPVVQAGCLVRSVIPLLDGQHEALEQVHVYPVPHTPSQGRFGLPDRSDVSHAHAIGVRSVGIDQNVAWTSHPGSYAGDHEPAAAPEASWVYVLAVAGTVVLAVLLGAAVRWRR